MIRTIDFCIPFVAEGIRYLEYLIGNVERTAAEPERIRFIVSYHTDNDYDVLKKSRIYKKINRTVVAPAFSKELVFFSPANHASAINTLVTSCSSDADIVIFSDYDMAFVYPEWDTLLERYFYTDHLELCGVTYMPRWLQFFQTAIDQIIPVIKNLNLAKYQQLPTLSFFCIRGAILRETFPSHLTHFDEFIASGGLPFRLISTPELASENNIPLGAMQWLDTGFELPELIRKKNIPYTIFPYTSLSQQTVLKEIENYKLLPVLDRPEVFYCQPENLPFLCHFKKGTMKSEHSTEYTFDRFTADVDAFLKQLKQ